LAAAGLESNLRGLEQRVAQACRRSGRSPGEVTLVAVTKTVAAGDIARAFELGIRHFGENRVQEAESKIAELSHLAPSPVWHMIGRLQSNKIKRAVELFDVIQSVDSAAQAEMINRRAHKRLPVFLEVNAGGEKSKAGFSPDEAAEAFPTISRLANLEVRGLMTVAPAVDNPEKVRGIFRKMRELRAELGLEQLSMGMSDDFEVAIEEGATMIRIGQALFGARG
jgi:PLP dependent protein